MELFLNIVNKTQFIDNLYHFLKETIDTNHTTKYFEYPDRICIGCKNLYAYIKTNDIIPFDCFEDEYNVKLNLDIEIELYNNDAFKDVAILSNWILDNFEGDFLLLHDSFGLVMARSNGHIMIDEKDREEIEFPYHLIEQL